MVNSTNVRSYPIWINLFYITSLIYMLFYIFLVLNFKINLQNISCATYFIKYLIKVSNFYFLDIFNIFDKYILIKYWIVYMIYIKVYILKSKYINNNYLNRI